jgi:GAF domain-containing protein
MSSATTTVVLIVDPGGSDRRAASAAIDTDSHRVVEAASVADAKTAFEETDPDCVVTEHEFPDGTGLELVEWVRDRAPDTPCVFYTDTEARSIRTAAFQAVVVEYLPKDLPDAPAKLARLIANTLEQRSQVAYPLPDDEDERLAAIEQYDVTGLEANDTVERLTALVGNHFDVAVAFAGIVDAHEERILACHGADWERFEREETICTHTIVDDEPTVVEDTQADIRFSDIQTLEDLDIRAYAGVPLKTPGGVPIGALCLIHDEPRSYSEAELDDLQLFADELMENLELRRRLRDRPQEAAR